MSRILLSAAFVLWAVSSFSQTFYIVRHAEKATQEPNMSSDVPLSNAGKQRADALKDLLKDKKITHIYSTNTIRTKTTAMPTADYFKLSTEVYGPRPDSAFISLLKTLKGNTLIVGHSNTVDDIVNMLCGRSEIPADLPETEYDNLFIVTKTGNSFTFARSAYNKPAD